MFMQRGSCKSEILRINLGTQIELVLGSFCSEAVKQ